MQRYCDHRYGQRWQVECAISMIKRRQGGYVLGRSNAARSREMMLKVLTHNVMILLLSMQGFYRAAASQFFVPHFLSPR